MTSPAPQNRSSDVECSESEWLARLHTGDERAFERIFRTYVTALCEFAHSYVRNRDTAQEVVQDLFCAIWEQRFTIEMPHGARAYLYAAVRNRSLNALRNARVEVSFHEYLSREANESVASTSPDAEIAARDLSQALARVIADMPPRCREVFTLVRRQHLPYAEVARILGLSAKTVEVHMSRALAILRVELAAWIRP